MKNHCLILLFTLFAASHGAAQQAGGQAVQKANDLYRQQQYSQAEAAYKEVLDRNPGNATAAFNRANALYRQTRPDEAIQALDELVNQTNDAAVKAKAYYNKGVILSGQKKLEESIEAYKNALRQNPGDKEARENLQKALLELKKKQPPKKDEQKKQEQQKKQQQQQPKMNQKEAEQRMKLLEQKEKEVQQRMQQSRKANSSQSRDW